MIGKTLGHYEILDKLGQGGMGEVFRARDTRLDRLVAIKVLPAELARDPERVARFRREARLLASLHHTHIAALHGLEEVDDQVFLAMELVEGEDLSARIARGRLDLDEALEYARQFAEGLEAAHEQNIVHRDLKPANLKINRDGQLKILDFGLARAYLGEIDDGDMEQSPTITAALTAHGVILGTAAYMSPEQARGRNVDQRTDIWAFGAILFEMLTGSRLFQGETISDTMAAVLRADPQWDLLPEGTPHGVRRLLERCLERDGRRRLRDIGEARVRLERWRDDPSSMDESLATLMVAPDPARSKAARWAWSAFAVAALAAAFLGWRLSTAPEPPARAMDLELAVVDGEELASAGNLASLSPDGQWLAWTTPAGVWVRELANRDARLLEGTDGTFSLCFSPDSQWIAIAARGVLGRVSVSGGTPITIGSLTTPRGIAWVDATTIVCAPDITSGLLLIDVGTGETRPLTQLDSDANERSHRWPTVVPGRRAVLFECQYLGRDYDQSDIQIIDLDGGPRRTLHRGGAAPLATDHGQLLFVRGSTLFAVQFDAGAGTTSGLPLPVRDDVVTSVGNQENDDGSAQYSVDRRGTLLYLDSRGARAELSRLSWLDLASGQITPIGQSSRNDRLSLSPDGRLAIVAHFRDGDSNLYVCDLESGNESLLTIRPSVEYPGAWSPDSRVFYWSQSSDAGDRFEVWRRPVDGSSPPQFVAASPGPAGIWPNDISPDGRFLACSVWMGGDLRDIVILDLEDIEAGFKAFSPNPNDHNNFCWFNQDFVVYREGRGEAGSVLMRRFPDTGALWSFPDTDEGYWGVTPAASGDAIFLDGPEGVVRFATSTEGGIVRIGRGEMVRTWTLEEKRRLFDLLVHPDGKRALALYSDDPKGGALAPQLVLVTNWLDEVRDRLDRGR